MIKASRPSIPMIDRRSMPLAVLMSLTSLAVGGQRYRDGQDILICYQDALSVIEPDQNPQKTVRKIDISCRRRQRQHRATRFPPVVAMFEASARH
ncbi:MAG: hypothetical protein ACR2RA_00080, partial [Geminicoccaceae bacterium]